MNLRRVATSLNKSSTHAVSTMRPSRRDASTDLRFRHWTDGIEEFGDPLEDQIDDDDEEGEEEGLSLPSPGQSAISEETSGTPSVGNFAV